MTVRAAPDQGSPLLLDRKYLLQERLGEGAAGVVYRAFHVDLKRSFAIKLLRPVGSPDPAALARFRREAEALGRLRHPHVVEVTDFGIDPPTGRPYLVMELLEGTTLADFCREHGALPLERALPILAAVAGAVDAAHAQGILHRDLKPGNVLLCEAPEGEPPVKVLDFGLAELAGPRPEEDGVAEELGTDAEPPRLTATGALLGTPLSVAPEVIRHREASRASDLYSFGVIAYELLAGRPPFQGTTAEVLAGHLEEEPLPPAGLPEEVWNALREPLRKDPASRPASAREVVERLRQAAARAALARWRVAEIPRRAWIAALLGALLLLAALTPWPELPAERRLRDLRLRTAPARPPDPRILLVTVDEASQEGARSLSDRADEFGRTLARLLAAGARGVAIDLLLPPQWSESPAFSDLVVRHPEALTLAMFSHRDERVLGPECVAGLTAAALGPERTAGLFGFVNLDEDPDGVIRRGRLRYRDQSGQPRPSWAARALRGDEAPPRLTGDVFLLDSRIDWPRYDRISWHEVPAELERNPGRFRDQLVLVGGDFEGSGDDLHRVPHRSEGTGVVSGLTLQAMLVDPSPPARRSASPGGRPSSPLPRC